MSEVAQIEQGTNALAVVTPMEMIMKAVESGADLDKLEKAMELQFRWEANEARKAYIVALSGFQAEMPSIAKGKDVFYPVKGSSTEKTYAFSHAEYDKVIDAAKPLLQKHGLSFRHRLQPLEQGQQEVGCIISHIDGHEAEEATMRHGMDQSGGKNDIQGKGSTVSYLERYTLLAALGLATKGQDNESNLPADTITAEQAADIAQRLLDTNSDEALFLKMFKAECVEMMLAKDYKRAISALNKKAQASE